MNRSQKVKQVYRELREAVGEEFPAIELLQTAAQLVEIVNDDGPITGARLQGSRPIFDEKPVDQIMADGGWRVLAREGNWINEIDGDDTLSVCAREQLNNYGMEMAA